MKAKVTAACSVEVWRDGKPVRTEFKAGQEVEGLDADLLVEHGLAEPVKTKGKD